MMISIKPVNNEICIFGDCSIHLYSNDSYILAKEIIVNSKSVTSDDKSYHEFCIFFGLKKFIIALTRVTSIAVPQLMTIFQPSFPKRVTQSEVTDIGLFDHQLIYWTRKIYRSKRGSHKQIKFRSFNHHTFDLFEQELSKLNFANYQNYNDINKT